MFDTGRAILHSISEAGLSLPEPVLFINDAEKEMAREFPSAHFWEPQLQSVPEAYKYKSIVIFMPKQKDESRFLIAESLQLLRQGGVLICTATNEAGGKTLGKMLVEFGVPISDHSKHKCRVVWTTEPQKPPRS